MAEQGSRTEYFPKDGANIALVKNVLRRDDLTIFFTFSGEHRPGERVRIQGRKRSVERHDQGGARRGRCDVFLATPFDSDMTNWQGAITSLFSHVTAHY